MDYFIYDTTTGRPLCNASATELPPFMDAGTQYKLGRCEQTEYVDVATGDLIQKPTMSVTVSKDTVTANGTDKATLTGVPTGAALFIGGTAYGQADGSAIDLTFDLDGDYRFRASLFPYLDYTVVIHAT